MTVGDLKEMLAPYHDSLSVFVVFTADEVGTLIEDIAGCSLNGGLQLEAVSFVEHCCK